MHHSPVQPGRFDLLEPRMLLNADVGPAREGSLIVPAEIGRPVELGHAFPMQLRPFAAAYTAEADVDSPAGPWPESGGTPQAYSSGSSGGDFAPWDPVAPEAAYPLAPPPPPALFRFVTQQIRSGILLEDEAGNVRSSIDSGYSPFIGSQPAPETVPEAPLEYQHHQPPFSGETEPFEPPVDPPANPPVGPPSPEELAATPRVPWMPNYTVSDTMQAGQEFSSYRIPVGPVTDFVRLSVKPEHPGEPFGVKVDQVFLMGPRGNLVASVVGVAYMNEGLQQTLFIALRGAPAGGELVVRIVPILAPVSSDDGSAPPVGQVDPSSDWSGADFELNIKRGDASPKNPAEAAAYVAASVSPAPYLIYIPASAADRTAATAGPGSSASFAAADAGPAGGGPVADPGASKEVTVDEEGEGDEVADGAQAPSIFLGPLVSRTAAPLGPELATSTTDPTPSTARGGRPAPGSLDALASGLGLDTLFFGGRSSWARRGPEAVDPAAPSARVSEAALAVVKGAGGAPFLVGVVRSEADQDGDAALVANLEKQAAAAALLAEAPAPHESSAEDRESPEIVRAGLATRAVGFLVGLGLATGPLYPDLVAYARRKFFRAVRSPRRRRPARKVAVG